MPKAFDSWTVLPHGPIEKLADNLWRVEGRLPGGDSRRVMTVARLRDGRLVVHSAIALEEPLMAELEAFGTPAWIVVPNGYHRLDAKIFKQRYPDAVVMCPKGARKKVAQVVEPAASYDDFPADADVKLYHLDAFGEAEGVLEVRSPDGHTVVFNDAVFNLPKRSGVKGYVMGPTGKPSVPRLIRWFLLKDRRSFVRQLRLIAGTPDLKRIIVSHGAMITDDPKGVLTTLSDELEA